MAEIVEVDTDETETSVYGYYEQILTKTIHHFYISGEIGDPIKYMDMIFKIQTAGPNDTIYIHICSSGGNLGTTLQIITAMKSTPAHVICSIEAEAYSAASLLFLAADEFLVNRNSLMMVHDFSSGAFGKSAEHLSQISAEILWFKSLAEDYYFPFLSKKEISAILKGGDLWLHEDEINKRLDKMIKSATKK